MFRSWSNRSADVSADRTGFTPRQIIQLVLVVGLLVFALPAGVQAAGSLVTIQDSSTSAKARVDTPTNTLRVGGFTNILFDRSGNNTGGNTSTFLVPTSLYSQIRIFAETTTCTGYCDALTIECVEAGARTCVLVSSQTFDKVGYNLLADVPGRTIRITVTDTSGIGGWHVVVYGRTA